MPDAGGKHNKARPFVCKVCGRDFKKGVHLRIHMATHRSSVDNEAIASPATSTPTAKVDPSPLVLRSPAFGDPDAAKVAQYACIVSDNRSSAAEKCLAAGRSSSPRPSSSPPSP